VIRWHEQFRPHPERDPSGRMTILGPVSCPAERMQAYVRRRNPHAPEVAELYVRVGEAYGVRGDVAFCQSVYETQAWRAAYGGPRFRPILAEVWSSGANPRVIVEEHIRCLYGFATAKGPYDEPEGGLFAPLMRKGWRGSSPYWEQLGFRWGYGTLAYGADLVAMWRRMCEWAERNPWTMAKECTAEDRAGEDRTVEEQTENGG